MNTRRGFELHPEAAQDITDIWEYIAGDNPQAAGRVREDIQETIRGFNMIMDGEVDKYPEAAFNLVGSIEEAIAKGEKLLAEASK